MAALLSFLAVDIRVDGVALDAALPAPWIAERLADSTHDQIDAQDGRIKGRLSRSGPDIVVRSRVTVDLTIACVRCLEPAPVGIDADLSLLLQPQSRADSRRKTDQEYEFSASEADHDVYDGEKVVLDAFVRELILLEVPSFPLCRDDCPGIAPTRAAEEPAGGDPRLLPLNNFREKKDGPVTLDDLVGAARQRSAALGKRAVLKSSHSGGKRKK